MTPFEVLYEDNHILVAVKAPGVPTQGDASGAPDLLGLLRAYIKEKYNKPGEVYLGLVHRLDRPVGGLLVFARTSKAAARLSEQVRTHKMDKRYLAVCRGDAPEGRLRDYLRKDRTFTARVVSQDVPGAQEALLDCTPLQRREGLTLCEVELHTGRHHQIRAQLAARGAPLWGDLRYGDGRAGQSPALFAWHLGFDHPTTGKSLLFEQLPPDAPPWSLFDLSPPRLVF